MACVTSSGTYRLPSSMRLCMCVCERAHARMCVHTLVCVVWPQSSAKTNALVTQGWNFQPVFLYTHFWPWEARPEPTVLGFFKSVFLLQPMGFHMWSSISKALTPVAFFKKGQRTYHTLCVCLCCVSYCELLTPRNREEVRWEGGIEGLSRGCTFPASCCSE